MKRLSLREGNLPEKIKHLALHPGVLKLSDKPPEVWEFNDPEELMEYCQKRNVVKQVLKPFQAGTKEDSHFYMAAIVLEEETEGGIVVECHKIMFAKADTAFLRGQQAKYGDETAKHIEGGWKEKSKIITL